ncbi:helicase-related protein [Candidatus Phytoplasma mali]|uniref:helicase-related protein n=1 Tax=Apple proliferation phytoplasma TaxID=37692 RepID=UPI001E6456F6|nr:helicase-related protein [Candidatus Phytoplasma mali]
MIKQKPKKYENYLLTEINNLEHQKDVMIYGKIASLPKLFKKKVFRIHFKIFLENNILIEVITFNNLYLLDILKINQIIIVKGKYYNDKKTIIASLISTNLEIDFRIKPIYNFKDISDKNVTKIIKYILNKYPQLIKENLPLKIIKKYNFMTRIEAFKNLHLPENNQKLKLAFKRLKYEEAFIISKKLFQIKKNLPFKDPLEYNIKLVKKIITTIPFELTLSQKKTINSIYKDFKKQHQVQRLIQGDVGSGKTIIAFLSAFGVITAYKQVLMMAPTEILAQQHYLNFNKMFPGVKSVILTSKNKKKEILKKQIKNNEIQMIIGTHILANIDFFSLGLVIIDEQHKFGLEIKQKAIFKDPTANIIYLTATPIPKTLALTYLENIEVSFVEKNEMLNKKVITQQIKKRQMLEILKKNQQNNSQTYIVVPAIKDNKKNFNIVQITDYLETANIDNLYILHGKQNKEKQETLIKNFINNKCGILLATTIIEVGIDIPNVNTIIILGANYFGLSQLHQLRGRVGRGYKQGYCFLITEKENERLKILQKEHDGFVLSNYDLKKRGPGEFLGLKQSGYFKNRFLRLPQDFKILKQTKKDIEDLY